jgi:hypothetical protein
MYVPKAPRWTANAAHVQAVLDHLEALGVSAAPCG